MQVSLPKVSLAIRRILQGNTQDTVPKPSEIHAHTLCVSIAAIHSQTIVGQNKTYRLNSTLVLSPAVNLYVVAHCDFELHYSKKKAARQGTAA